MPLMRLYPIFLTLADARVLVAGAGTVGKRKIASLHEAGAGDILVLDIADPDDGLRLLLGRAGVRFLQRHVEAADIKGKTLVFAATSDVSENMRIAALCGEQGVLCNVATDPHAGSFHVPATAVAGDIVAAFSTGGNSPALARRIREEAEEWLGEHFSDMAVFMGRLRPLVLAGGGETRANSVVFRALVASSLGQALASRDASTARKIVRDILPTTLHAHIEDLLHGLC